MNNFFTRLRQTAQLMVGVGDYNAYLSHMRTQHPNHAPLTPVEYFQRCQRARYPSKDGAIKRCPC